MATLAAHQVGRRQGGWLQRAPLRALRAGVASPEVVIQDSSRSQCLHSHAATLILSPPHVHRCPLCCCCPCSHTVSLTPCASCCPRLLQLKQEELQLLRPVAARGQRETKKQALRRALQLQRAGVDLPTNVRLLQERDRPQGPPQEEESEEESEDEDEEGSGSSGGESEGEGPAPGTQAGPPAKKQRTAGSAAEVAQQQQQRQRQQQAGLAGAGQAAATAKQQQQQAAAALREAALSSKRELGIAEGRDDEAEGGPQPGQRPGRGAMPAGPDGKPRVVIVERRPEIQQVR